jgi:hypothetical protein
MNKPGILLFACAWCCVSLCASASARSPLMEIMENLGNIGMDGHPNLSFDIADASEVSDLARLGFAFKLVHRVAANHGRSARTEWQIPCLRTAVHLDGKGNLIWIAPSGRTVRFRKLEDGFAKGNDGSEAKAPGENEIEITTSSQTRWKYRNGFIETITDWKGIHVFTTDRESILSIARKGHDRDDPVLEVLYTDKGLLSGLRLPGGKTSRFRWSPEHRLLGVDGSSGMKLDFEYENTLLTGWRLADGPLNTLKWKRLESMRLVAFQRPPVLLAEDSFYHYEWSRHDGIDILVIRRKTGSFLSETRFGPAGMEQRTPYGTTKFSFPRRKN